MNKKQVLELQKKLSQFHKYLCVLMIIYIFESFVRNEYVHSLKSLYIIVFVFLLDMLLATASFFERRRVLMVLRYIEYCTCSLFWFITDYKVHGIMACICTVIFVTEYIIIFDFSELYHKIIGFISICIPMLFFLAMDSLFWRRGKVEFFDMLCAVGLFIAIVIFFSLILEKITAETNKKLFAQTRLVADINAMNKDLRVKQEKVKKVNEQLGIQKLQLKVAYKKLNTANTEMMIQNEIIKYISSSLEIGRLMVLITESIIDKIGLDFSMIVLNPGAGSNKKIKHMIRTKLSQDLYVDFQNAIEKGHLDKYLKSNELCVDNCVNYEIYPFLDKNQLGSLLIIPLIQDTEQIGILCVGHTQTDYFKDNIEFYKGIVAQFLIALRNANLYAKMEDMAIKDGLTGIFNRGHLTKLVHSCASEALETKAPMTVALFDIDKFKNINDTYGHLFGDEVIKVVASLADDFAVKHNGAAGRYGGEEFVIVLPGKYLDESYQLIKVLHEEIRNKELHFAGKLVPVRVSIGIAAYPETTMNPSDLISRADAAMYYSKRNGRDRITLDSDAIRDAVNL